MDMENGGFCQAPGAGTRPACRAETGLRKGGGMALMGPLRDCPSTLSVGAGVRPKKLPSQLGELRFLCRVEYRIH